MAANTNASSSSVTDVSPLKYVPLKYTLMGTFLLLIIPILIAMSVSDYLNSKKDLESAYELLQKQTENNIVNAIKLVDAGYKVLERFLGKEMEKSFQIFIDAYEKNGRDPSKLDLEKLKVELGGKMDLYVINAEGVVEYTTYTKDIGLDFKPWPDVYKLLTDVRLANRFVNGGLAAEARTGLLRKFAYISTPDNRYVLELGLTSDEFKDLMGELDVIRITDRLKTLNPSLSSVRIYSRHGHALDDPNLKVDKETADIIMQVYDSKLSHEFFNHQRKRLVRYLFVNLKDDNLTLAPDPSRVIELTYNTKLIDESLQRIAAFHFILSVAAIILSIIFTFFISGWITKPIQKLVESVNIIAQGNLEHPIEGYTNNELKLLKQSITLMVDNMILFINKIKQQNLELKELDKLKDDFLSNTSHELRTPINGIIGIADSMVDGAAGPLSKKAIENLSMIVLSGRRLSNLVNDILDFSKLKHKNIQLQIKPIDIKIITDVVVTLSQPLIGKKNIKLINRIKDLPPVSADENRVQQILHNLIGNAIKFTEFGTIEIEAKVHQAEYLMVVISDTGIGIRADKMAQLFTPFEQIDGSITREFSGTGLGLSISKQLVELHGGEIQLQSTLGVGTKVSFTLPLSKGVLLDQNSDAAILVQRLRENASAADTIESLENDITEINSEKLRQSPTNSNHLLEKINESAVENLPIEFLDEDKQNTTELLVAEDDENTIIDIAKHVYKDPKDCLQVLIVDDDPINLQVLENQLMVENYAVTRALNGFEALAAMESGQAFAIVLLDIMMPKMSGFEVCKIIRQTHPATSLPIIMLTAKNQVSDLVEGLQAGANDYLTKPFTKGELITRIKTHVQLAQVNIAYSNFVPLEFLKLLEKESIIDVRLGDHVQKHMAVLFADIRSFTTLSEAMTPKENFEFINNYLGRVSPVIRKHNGFIDKYIGDAIMALFPEKADDAVQAAIEIHKQLDLFNQERLQMNKPAVKVGIGVHIGTLMLGTIGETKRMEGTVISDAVNLASRLEGLTKPYGVSIIISGDILAELEDPSVYFYRFLGKVRVKGKLEPVQIFEVVDAEPADVMDKKIALEGEFHSAIELFYQQKFRQAAKQFQQILNYLPQDKAAEFYLERCHQYIEKGPPQDWSGVEALLEK